MKIYVAGPMRNIPEFNFPAFATATAKLRSESHEVYSPAEYDIAKHGENFSRENANGSEAEAETNYGFNIREAMGAHMAWICAEADAIAMLPGWENSKGATAERAVGLALGLQIITL